MISEVEAVQSFLCYLCEEDLDTASDLHHHHTHRHTIRELSLAVLALQNVDIAGIDDNIMNNNFLLPTDIGESPCNVSTQSDDVDSDSESTVTSESKMRRCITTVDAARTKVCSIKTLPKSQTRVRKKVNPKHLKSQATLGIDTRMLGFGKMKPASGRSSHSDANHDECQRGQSARMSVTKCSTKQMVSMPGSSIKNGRQQCIKKGSETDTDIESKQFENECLVTTVKTDTSPELAHSDVDSHESLCDEVSMVDLKKLPLSNRSKPGLLQNGNTLYKHSLSHCVESCTEKQDHIAEKSGHEIQLSPFMGFKSDLSFSSVSFDSILSPDNSFQPENHVETTLIQPTHDISSDSITSSKQGRRTKRMKQKKPQKFVDECLLPVPVTRHRASVHYDYINPTKTSNSMDDVYLEDYLVPVIKYKPLDTDVEFSTIDLKQKSNLDPVSLTSLAKGGSENESEMLSENDCCNKHKASKKKKNDLEIQIVECSTNVKKMVAFRKRKSDCRKKATINSNTITTKTVSAAVPKREAFTPISAASTENITTHVLGDLLPTSSRSTLDVSSLMRIYPSGAMERRFFCEPCGKGYKKKSHLERHLRVHTGERPFPCQFCEKRFAVRSILKQHVRIHTGEKPYRCPVCDQRFPQKSGLMTHTMLHTGKPFKCDHCEKAFVSNHKLLQHLRSHSIRLLHPCSSCPSEFFTEGALLEHSKVHSSHQ